VLRPGETLEAALLRAGVGRRDAAGIARSLAASVDLRRLRPGERLEVSRPADGQPPEVTHWRSPAERFEIRRHGDGWLARPVHLPVTTRVVAIAGRLERSLFASMEGLGENAALTAKFVGLFEWDFDFAADSLPGDRFRMLVEKRYVEGEFIGYGDILIAQYASEDRPVLTAVAFVATDGRIAYFDAHGRSVRKAFLRAPLDFTRITSGYSQARRHPILGGIRPHLAVDYAAPEGTPVRAVADGVVEQAGWDGGNGIRIVLRHAQGYRTMYNHLSRVHVKPGQRVQQRDVIGRVGSTGLSTGPHLDYRVNRNGRFVNPLSERFIPGVPVPRARLEEFRRHLEDLRGGLEREASFPEQPRGS
jgi:murein DD-endopeptidase MepM/ murein hydrolase activator NlpD